MRPEHSRAKLTESEVLAIDAALRAGGTVKEVAAQFATSSRTVYGIKRRSNWRYLLCNQAEEVKP